MAGERGSTYASGAGNAASQGYGGHGRGCGTFTIDALAYDVNCALRTFDVRFEAHCEGLSEALRGAFHFRAALTPRLIEPGRPAAQ